MARLERSVPGTRFTKARAVEALLFKRDRPLPKGRVVVGDTFNVAQMSVRANRHLVDAYPNAPLLKRMVLYPYVQECYAPIKKIVGDRSAPWDLLNKKATPHAFQLYQAAKVPPVQGCPLKQVTLGLKPLPARVALPADVADDERYEFGAAQ